MNDYFKFKVINLPQHCSAVTGCPPGLLLLSDFFVAFTLCIHKNINYNRTCTNTCIRQSRKLFFVTLLQKNNMKSACEHNSFDNSLIRVEFLTEEYFNRLLLI